MDTPTLQDMAREVMRAYDWSLTTLAARIGISIPSLHRLVHVEGASTRWEYGRKIEALFIARPSQKRVDPQA